MRELVINVFFNALTIKLKYLKSKNFVKETLEDLDKNEDGYVDINGKF